MEWRRLELIYGTTLVWCYFWKCCNTCYIVWNLTVLWRAYRLCAYWLYTSWVYGRLGLHCRRVIAACVVTAVRAALPADHGQYTGFVERSGDELSLWPWWSGNTTCLRQHKGVSEEVSSADILQIDTVQQYMTDCKWMSTSAASWLIVTR